MVDGELNFERHRRGAVRRREYTLGQGGGERPGWTFGEGVSGGRYPRGGGRGEGAVVEWWKRNGRRCGISMDGGGYRGKGGPRREVRIGHVVSNDL